MGLTESCGLQTGGQAGTTSVTEVVQTLLKDHMTETKLTGDLRNDNYKATLTIPYSRTET